ncbi:hypothetical protein [Paraburkholderia sp. UYCP14C]|uniref:hypothetical protein n=1 Tax=Paraburkholderia sp. UYCP14C TaxID=2511130 RepID=UPI001459FFDF|nr:hypothetical protein [Paraburkholderia sp. UYCP14C]
MDQWRERLQSFFALDPHDIGAIGGGKAKFTDRIDVAMLQSWHQMAPRSAFEELWPPFARLNAFGRLPTL